VRRGGRKGGGDAMIRPPTEATTRKAPRGRGAKWLGNEHGIVKSHMRSFADEKCRN